MMKDRTATEQLSIILVMRSEAEKIAQRMTSPSSEALTRILYTELIDRVIEQIEIEKTNRQEYK
jgi:predicted solute-binding protein